MDRVASTRQANSGEGQSGAFNSMDLRTYLLSAVEKVKNHSMKDTKPALLG
jgi:hypothetical protein